MEWNLEDEDLNKEGSGGDMTIFNNGEPGECEATISIERKAPDDTSNGPDYKVVYTDESGGSINSGYWTDEPDEDWKMEKRRKELRNLRSLIKTVLGPTALASLPKKVNSTKEAFDSHFNLMKSSGIEGRKVVVFANYGTKSSKKAGKYLEPRSWPPFVRNVGQGDPIVPGNIDQMEQISPDSVSGSPVSEAPTVDDWN